MADVLMIAMVLGFFAVCIAYVSWCGRIIGPDDEVLDATSAGSDTEATDAELVAS